MRREEEGLPEPCVEYDKEQEAHGPTYDLRSRDESWWGGPKVQGERWYGEKPHFSLEEATIPRECTWDHSWKPGYPLHRTGTMYSVRELILSLATPLTVNGIRVLRAQTAELTLNSVLWKVWDIHNTIWSRFSRSGRRTGT